MRLALCSMFIFSLVFWSCQPEPRKAKWDYSTTQLLCEDLTVSPESPIIAVYLRVAEQKTKIAEINSACNNLAAEELSTYEMPAEVLSAIGGWWAGSGDYLYAILENEEVVVYQGFADEMQETPGYNYRRIASFDGEKFKLEPMQ